MSDLIFYTNPMSRGRIARWMLEEVGEPYQTVLVDWQDKPQALLDANPLGKVPTIVHDGRTVTEAAAICLYLADVFPQAKLAPTDAERADYYRWTLFCAGPLEAAVTDKSLGVMVPPDRRAMVGYGSLDEAITTLEGAVGRYDYIAGDRFTAADVYVGSAVGWFTQFGILPKEGAFATYLERVSSRPAAIRAREIDDALLPTRQPA
jgi:glutathione S-transferase